MKVGKSGPVFLAFLCMGFGDVVGPLTSQLQSEFQLTNVVAGLVTFAGFIMFGLLSIPLGIYQDRTTKKHVLLMGLVLALFGLLLPIIGQFSSFALLLTSLLLLGTGATTLQVAGNPIMRDVSAEGMFSRNLSFGQFVKAIGSLSGAVVPLAAANYLGMDWKILFPLYAVIVLLAAIYLFLTRIEEKKSANSQPASFTSCFRLLKNRYISMMVIGIFLYVGAEVCMSSKLPNYLAHQFDFDIQKLGLWGTLTLFLALMMGRFAGGIVLNWLKPQLFLIISTILSIVGIIGLFIAAEAWIAMGMIVIIGLGFANVFPLIFSITVDAMPERSNEISGLMVTAIIGGAIVPVLFGWIADTFSLMAGFIVPLVCLAYVGILALRAHRRDLA